MQHSRENIKFVVVDFAQELSASLLTEQIKKQLEGKITDFEVALNFSSGSGKEHMAIIEAVLELGLNFRLVTFSGNQLEVMGIKK